MGIVCDQCWMSGKVDGKTCKKCGGSGMVPPY